MKLFLFSLLLFTTRLVFSQTDKTLLTVYKESQITKLKVIAPLKKLTDKEYFKGKTQKIEVYGNDSLIFSDNVAAYRIFKLNVSGGFVEVVEILKTRGDKGYIYLTENGRLSIPNDLVLRDMRWHTREEFLRTHHYIWFEGKNEKGQSGYFLYNLKGQPVSNCFKTFKFEEMFGRLLITDNDGQKSLFYYTIDTAIIKDQAFELIMPYNYLDYINNGFLFFKRSNNTVDIYTTEGKKVNKEPLYKVEFNNLYRTKKWLLYKNESNLIGIFSVIDGVFTDPQFSDVKYYDGDALLVTMKDKAKWAVLNKDRKWISSYDYDNFIHAGIDESIIVSKNGKKGVIDQNDKKILPFNYFDINRIGGWTSNGQGHLIASAYQVKKDSLGKKALYSYKGNQTTGYDYDAFEIDQYSRKIVGIIGNKKEYFNFVGERYLQQEDAIKQNARELIDAYNKSIKKFRQDLNEFEEYWNWLVRNWQQKNMSESEYIRAANKLLYDKRNPFVRELERMIAMLEYTKKEYGDKISTENLKAIDELIPYLNDEIKYLNGFKPYNEVVIIKEKE